MTRLLVIGIDGMDRELISKYIDYLPNFKRIIKKSPKIRLNSVFPPDSDTAWASIYTGLNPARHGIVEFVDPLKRANINETDDLDVAAIRGKTFWDIAGKFGKKVCLIYPHIAYPVWPVNGFMINSSPKTEEFQMYPSDFKFNFEIKKLDVLKRLPKSKFEFKEYLKKKRHIVINEFNFSSKMLINYEWDMFFFYSSALDSIMHIFWNYCDANDPTYPGDNPFKEAIKNFHILYDKLIGEMLKKVDYSTPILIFSDHGHSMRPVNLFNINEILRNEGYLLSKEEGLVPIHNVTEKLKRATVNIAQMSGLRPAAMTVLRKFPILKDMYTAPSSIDFDKTIAHCTDLSGMKSYNYGGITIYKGKFNSEEEYSSTRNRIINLLSRWRVPNSKENVFEWICEREELYSGPYIEKYPDIVFNLKDEYGVGWAVKVPFFSKSAHHKFFPGSHRRTTPIFYMLNPGEKKCIEGAMTLMDIAPTILDLLKIEWKKYDFDGESILKW
ncbi:hypothetical protein C6A36_00200 [Desulfobacteraceae bacterium SEEP-SAG10]|nr:hypothetical protein C6A36_00200 [Desulfobacteraceae bacterium SEEP-SAG10]